MKQYICVFCASANGASPLYTEAARVLGRLIAHRGFGLVYGGATVGAMGALADAALAAGGEVVGVIPEVIREREIDHKGLTELHVVGTMHERKALMASRADAFIALPGGYGTLDEFIEIVTWAQLRIHSKPCVLVNTAVGSPGTAVSSPGTAVGSAGTAVSGAVFGAGGTGFYDGFLRFLDHTVDQGFIQPENRRLIQVARDPEEALALIEQTWRTQAEIPTHDPRLDAVVR